MENARRLGLILFGVIVGMRVDASAVINLTEGLA